MCTALLAAVAVLASAVPAGADTTIGSAYGFKYRESIASVGVGSPWVDKAGCGKTRSVFSGGTDTTGIESGSFLQTDAPGGSSWRGGGFVSETGKNETTYALCEKAGAPTTIASKRLRLPAAPAIVRSRQSCPSGQEVVGGGVAVSPQPGVHVSSSYPDVDGWHATVVNDAQGSQAFRVYAVCRPATDRYGIHVFADSPFTSNTFSVGAPCFFANEVPVSGGIDISGPPADSHLADSGPEDDLGDPDPLPDDFWSTGVASDAGDPVADGRTWAAYVVCKVVA
jgi:hypothetical protein